MSINNTNAWREILARIFAGLSLEREVRPSWLVNPDTKRPLKLDLLYPEIGVAIRLSGRRGRQQRGRTSLDEEAMQGQRDRARFDLCAAHGISLADLDVAADEPVDLFDTLESAFSHATRRLRADDTLSDEEKSGDLEKLIQARSKSQEFKRKIHTMRDLDVYHDLWRDRLFQEADTSSSSMESSFEPLPALSDGLTIEHTHFGRGVIQSISLGATDGDALVTIQFDSGEEKMFMAGLLAGKMSIVSS